MVTPLNIFFSGTKRPVVLTWYAALEMWSLPGLHQWLFWVDLDLFNGWSHMIPIAYISIESWNVHFSITVWAKIIILAGNVKPLRQWLYIRTKGQANLSSVSLSLSHWYPGSGVVLDCIDSWSLQPYLLSFIQGPTYLHVYIFVCFLCWLFSKLNLKAPITYCIL